MNILSRGPVLDLFREPEKLNACIVVPFENCIPMFLRFDAKKGSTKVRFIADVLSDFKNLALKWIINQEWHS